ncbi:hypothetical protein B0H65DRAFT_480781 [Neurospora tetraspora]|uniref:Uncharacterized protein n=1 Tax=Neurospora tetraspora TaxID=94610 RepID=A0AAE0ML39_9PEZI|nr:hypothetical protein B0H65DRAFT_480781 [Neurospora tetraspora]
MAYGSQLSPCLPVHIPVPIPLYAIAGGSGAHHWLTPISGRLTINQTQRMWLYNTIHGFILKGRKRRPMQTLVVIHKHHQTGLLSGEGMAWTRQDQARQRGLYRPPYDSIMILPPTVALLLTLKNRGWDGPIYLETFDAIDIPLSGQAAGRRRRTGGGRYLAQNTEGRESGGGHPRLRTEIIFMMPWDAGGDLVTAGRQGVHLIPLTTPHRSSRRHQASTDLIS